MPCKLAETLFEAGKSNVIVISNCCLTKVAIRVRRNCSTIDTFEKRSKEYQGYLVYRGYNPSLVKQQFEKAKSISTDDLLTSKAKEAKIIFPSLLDFNPRLHKFGKIVNTYKHLPAPSCTLFMSHHV